MSIPDQPSSGEQPSPDDQRSTPQQSTGASRAALLWEQLSGLGMADSLVRMGTHALSVFLVLLAAWAMHFFYQSIQSAPPASKQSAAVLAAEIPTATPLPPPPQLAPLPDIKTLPRYGITRLALPKTTIPTRPRTVVTTYTVQPGDTIFGISEKFGLKPETILWGNYAILADDPHRLRPGQELNILPVDGTYYQWQAGDGLNGVAGFYGVTTEEIVSYPANNLVAAELGDYSNPNIPAGTWLVVPGGTRDFVSWSAPRITRSDPSVAKVLGPGHCGAISEGPVGSGYFVWPANNHFLSGYDYWPSSNHYGIDVDGNTGDPIYASDSGVVVYAGWNDWGYGYMIVVDHGTGWQTLYAHLSSLNVGCGSYAYQGDVIAAMGSTGNSTGSHLHFELMHDQYGKVNPWDFLP